MRERDSYRESYREGVVDSKRLIIIAVSVLIALTAVFGGLIVVFGIGEEIYQNEYGDVIYFLDDNHFVLKTNNIGEEPYFKFEKNTDTEYFKSINNYSKSTDVSYKIEFKETEGIEHCYFMQVREPSKGVVFRQKFLLTKTLDSWYSDIRW